LIILCHLAGVWNMSVCVTCVRLAGYYWSAETDDSKVKIDSEQIVTK